jgi:hypothetical protein
MHIEWGDLGCDLGLSTLWEEAPGLLQFESEALNKEYIGANFLNCISRTKSHTWTTPNSHTHNDIISMTSSLSGPDSDIMELGLYW